MAGQIRLWRATTVTSMFRKHCNQSVYLWCQWYVSQSGIYCSVLFQLIRSHLPALPYHHWWKGVEEHLVCVGCASDPLLFVFYCEIQFLCSVSPKPQVYGHNFPGLSLNNSLVSMWTWTFLLVVTSPVHTGHYKITSQSNSNVGCSGQKSIVLTL